MTGSDERAREVERVAQAIYEAGGSFSDQNGSIAWSDLDGSNDAENFRAMALAALAASRPTDAGEPVAWRWDSIDPHTHACVSHVTFYKPYGDEGDDKLFRNIVPLFATLKPPVDEASFDIAYNGGYAAGAIGADKLRAATERFVDIVDRLGRGNNAIHDAIIEVRAALSARNLTGDGAGA